MAARIRHIAIVTKDVQKLVTFYTTVFGLKVAGGAISNVDKRPGNREAEYRVYDPDGNGVDLSVHGWPL